MGDRGEHVAGEKLPEEQHLLLVAGGAKPACLARERHEELMAAFRAAHAGETLFEIAALEKLADHLGDHVAEDAVAGLVALGIDLEKLLEMGVTGSLAWSPLRPFPLPAAARFWT